MVIATATVNVNMFQVTSNLTFALRVDVPALNTVDTLKFHNDVVKMIMSKTHNQVEDLFYVDNQSLNLDASNFNRRLDLSTTAGSMFHMKKDTINFVVTDIAGTPTEVYTPKPGDTHYYQARTYVITHNTPGAYMIAEFIGQDEREEFIRRRHKEMWSGGTLTTKDSSRRSYITLNLNPKVFKGYQIQFIKVEI